MSRASCLAKGLFKLFQLLVHETKDASGRSLELLAGVDFLAVVGFVRRVYLSVGLGLLWMGLGLTWLLSRLALPGSNVGFGAELSPFN